MGAAKIAYLSRWFYLKKMGGGSTVTEEYQQDNICL